MYTITLPELKNLLTEQSNPSISLFLPIPRVGREQRQGKLILKQLLREMKSNPLLERLDEDEQEKRSRKILPACLRTSGGRTICSIVAALPDLEEIVEDMPLSSTGRESAPIRSKTISYATSSRSIMACIRFCMIRKHRWCWPR